MRIDYEEANLNIIGRKHLSRMVLMNNRLLASNMRPRQILGLAMIFLFLPTNSGLYLSLLEGATPSDKVPGSFVIWLCGLFVIGVLLVLVPPRENIHLSIDESE